MFRVFPPQESQLISGVAFKKTFSYAGFEMQPKRYENPKIALLNVELELKAEKDNAEVRVKSVEVRIQLSKLDFKMAFLLSLCPFYSLDVCPSLSSGLPGHRGRRVEHPVRQTGEDLSVRSQGGFVQVAHRRRGHPVLCRQGPVLCRPGAGGGSEKDHDGKKTNPMDLN